VILEGREIREGFPISIHIAEFKQKGETYKPREKTEIDDLAKIKFKAN
jgi:hypothetical protein